MLTTCFPLYIPVLMAHFSQQITNMKTKTVTDIISIARSFQLNVSGKNSAVRSTKSPPFATWTVVYYLAVALFWEYVSKTID